MIGLEGQSYQCFLRTKIGSRDLYSTKGDNINFHSFVQSFDLQIRSKSAPPSVRLPPKSPKHYFSAQFELAESGQTCAVWRVAIRMNQTVE